MKAKCKRIAIVIVLGIAILMLYQFTIYDTVKDDLSFWTLGEKVWFLGIMPWLISTAFAFGIYKLYKERTSESN